MNSTTISVRRSIAVDAPQQRTFDAFLDMTAWWPLDTHTIGKAPASASIIERQPAGRWYNIDADGIENNIGRVLLFDPPERVVLSWEISCGWTYDPSMRTEVEVRFIAETPTRTRVELEHRGLEAYGDRAEAQRDVYESDGAWTFVLGRFAASFG